jgi:hypothetical protein
MTKRDFAFALYGGGISEKEAIHQYHLWEDLTIRMVNNLIDTKEVYERGKGTDPVAIVLEEVKQHIRRLVI